MGFVRAYQFLDAVMSNLGSTSASYVTLVVERAWEAGLEVSCPLEGSNSAQDDVWMALAGKSSLLIGQTCLPPSTSQDRFVCDILDVCA